MPKRQSPQVAAVRERRRLTAEYLDWAREQADPALALEAKRDLARHERELAKLGAKRFRLRFKRRKGQPKRLGPRRQRLPKGSVRAFVRDAVAVAVFTLTASFVTFVSHWDVGLVGLLDGLAAAMAYLYFAKETGRLRL